jgi:LuxR family transcriptional regulator, regulator of acetate metabolism
VSGSLPKGLSAAEVEAPPSNPLRRGLLHSAGRELPTDRAGGLVGVGQALRCLRGAVSLPALFRHATYAICESVGFERAAVFSLRGQTLVAESVYELGAPERHEGALRHLRPQPLELGPRLHESEVLRRRTALLVKDAVSDWRARGTLPSTRSYVVAPVICQQRAVGLIHADRGVTGEAVTELDRDTLWAFAEGFGYALERTLLADRLRAQSDHVLALVRSTEASVTELSRPDIDLPSRLAAHPTSGAPEHPLGAAGGDSASTAGSAAPVHELYDALTRRELEVLAMLAEGDTNAGIAQRLVVSEGTIKTHVKHILRKLGVQNRSQAVSCYFRTETASGERRFAAAADRPA